MGGGGREEGVGRGLRFRGWGMGGNGLLRRGWVGTVGEGVGKG